MTNKEIIQDVKKVLVRMIRMEGRYHADPYQHAKHIIEDNSDLAKQLLVLINMIDIDQPFK